MQTTKLFISAIALLSFCATVTPAASSDIPQRKSGLWEVDIQLPNNPEIKGAQQCVDHDTDNLINEEAATGMKLNCAVQDQKQDGDKLTINYQCKSEEMTITSQSVFIGDFDTAYTNEVKSTMDPPMMGMSEMTMTMQAKWIGPCKPGQKPGDTVMPEIDTKAYELEMEKLDKQLKELENDPAFQKMMKGE